MKVKKFKFISSVGSANEKDGLVSFFVDSDYNISECLKKYFEHFSCDVDEEDIHYFAHLIDDGEYFQEEIGGYLFEYNGERDIDTDLISSSVYHCECFKGKNIDEVNTHIEIGKLLRDSYQEDDLEYNLVLSKEDNIIKENFKLDNEFKNGAIIFDILNQKDFQNDVLMFESLTNDRTIFIEKYYRF